MKRALDDRWGAAVCLRHLGLAAYDQGAYGEARRVLGESLTLSRAMGSPWSIAYSLNEWFALEGSLVSAFGGDVFQDGEMSKYVLFTGGGRIFWNRQPRRLSPWAHILAGMTHMNPQIANSSKNSFALQAGGGIDWYFNPRLSFRGEADFVHTQLYSDSQNNYQAGVGFVLHF